MIGWGAVKRALFSVLLAVLALLGGCRRDAPRADAASSASAGRLASAAPKASASADLAPAPIGPQWTRPLLFKVATKGRHFHLFGTIHLPDSRLDVFPPALEAAFEESQALFTEIPLDEATQASVAPSMMLPEGKTLQSIVPPPLYERVTAAFAQSGVPSVAIERLKPWAVSVQLSVLDRMITLALKKPIDVVLFNRAVGAGKEAGGIETATEQLSLFDTLKQSEQIELLRQAVDLRDRMIKEKRDLLEEMMVAYVNGAEHQLSDLIHEGVDDEDPLSAKLMKRMFTDRNKSMTERIVKKVGPSPAKIHFFAVGSGHLIGDDGIVARLRKQGFEVTRTVP